MSGSQSQVNLRQLRNQAKDLHHASQTHAVAADVLARIRRHHPRFAQATPQQVAAGFSLQEAQHTIAREQGHNSWPKLVAAVGDHEAADHRARFVSDELRGLETLHGYLAEYLQGAYRQAGDADAEVKIQFVDQVTWAEYLDSRPARGWSYGYTPLPLEGGAMFDVPLVTAQCLDRLAAGRISPTFLEDLLDWVEGRREEATISGDDHRRFIGRLLDHGLEMAWEPLMRMDMSEIAIEFGPGLPRRRIAEPADIAACVQLATVDGEVALRCAYPYRTLLPQLPALAKMGRRATA